MLEELTGLENEIFNCIKCEELTRSRLYPMPGFYGSSDIKLMVIGINPGPWGNKDLELVKKFNQDYRKAYEIGIKTCLVGSFLDKAFGALGVTWENIFITNLIKCATPNTRFPSDGEIENCKRYLRKQLSLIKPKNVLFISKFVTEKLKIDINPMERKIIANKNIISIYHPTYIRKNGLEAKTLEFLEKNKIC